MRIFKIKHNKHNAQKSKNILFISTKAWSDWQIFIYFLFKLLHVYCSFFQCVYFDLYLLMHLNLFYIILNTVKTKRDIDHIKTTISCVFTPNPLIFPHLLKRCFHVASLHVTVVIIEDNEIFYSIRIRIRLLKENCLDIDITR